ncbi:MAG: hypothetical protein H6555_07765 [Lewinellaceae bacterium]|nr:hypothetical protein [Lewinellaceae bacterium]
MLSIFRTSQLFFGVFLLLYAIFLHGSSWIIPIDWEPTNAGVWGQWVYGKVGFNTHTALTLGILLVFAQAIALNALESTFRLSAEVSLFPGVFLILVSSTSPYFLGLSPLHFANFFLLIALIQLMDTYKKASCADLIFNTGFWIGVASLFYPGYTVFILLAFAGLNILRSYNIRERLMVLLGFSVIHILVGTYYFWHNQFEQYWSVQYQEPFSLLSGPTFTLNWGGWLAILFFGILLMVMLFSQGFFLSKRIIQTQKRINILFWTLLIGGLTLLFQTTPGPDHLLIMAVPLGYLLSMRIISLDRNWAELIHFLLLAFVLFCQFEARLFG